MKKPLRMNFESQITSVHMPCQFFELPAKPYPLAIAYTPDSYSHFLRNPKSGIVSSRPHFPLTYLESPAKLLLVHIVLHLLYVIFPKPNSVTALLAEKKFIFMGNYWHIPYNLTLVSLLL